MIYEVTGRVQFLNISHSSFSMGVFPMVLWKNSCPILAELTKWRDGSRSNILPNLIGQIKASHLVIFSFQRFILTIKMVHLVLWLGYAEWMCWPNNIWDWSCKFSTCSGSLRLRASAPRRQTNTYKCSKQRLSFLNDWLLTRFEQHNGFETGKLRGVDRQSLETVEDLLQDLQVGGWRADLGRKLRQG